MELINMRLETAVGKPLSEVAGLFNMNVKAGYTNVNCKNVNVLQFDYALFDSALLNYTLDYRNKVGGLLEVDENHHFYLPKSGKFSRTIDNLPTKIFKYNEFIKWKYQVIYCVPIIYVTEYLHCSSESDLKKYLFEKFSIIRYGMTLDLFYRYSLYNEHFFKYLGAERLTFEKSIVSKEYRDFIIAYNNNELDSWINKYLINKKNAL
jgi:hypothetical protein